MAYIDVKAREAVAVGDDANDEAKRVQRQRLRSTAIAVGLAFLVVLFYAATIVRMGGQRAVPPVGEFAPGGTQSTTKDAAP